MCLAFWNELTLGVRVVCSTLNKYFASSSCCAPPWGSFIHLCSTKLRSEHKTGVDNEVWWKWHVLLAGETLKACVWFSMSFFPLPPGQAIFQTMAAPQAWVLEWGCCRAKQLLMPDRYESWPKIKLCYKPLRLLGYLLLQQNLAWPDGSIVVKSLHADNYYLTQQVKFLC